MRPELGFGQPRHVCLLTPDKLDRVQHFAETGEGQLPRNVILSMVAEIRTHRVKDSGPLDTAPSTAT